MFDGEEEKRLMREERIGPEIATFCNGRSSMAEMADEEEIEGGGDERESELKSGSERVLFWLCPLDGLMGAICDG